MRLLHTSTLKIVEFLGHVPEYAILSHSWAVDEVSFVDMRDRDTATKRAGYSKLIACCHQANTEGLEYVWIDTCCIDKRSSAEVAEAMNALFQWYLKAKVCYTYLADVGDDGTGFAESRWFTRGWALQELIASPTIKFFGKGWVEIGTKENSQKTLARITGIMPEVLRDPANLPVASVAQRMSWAAKRETTRIEDRAYSLMGLFGVNMAMIYGEGEKAFERLQLEIIKTSYDHSIFAWKGEGERRGLLARSPAEFADSGKIRSYATPPGAQPFSMTNLGLSISLPIKKKKIERSFTAKLKGAPVEYEPEKKAYLSCYYEGSSLRNPHITIYVEETRGVLIPGGRKLVGGGEAEYVRIRCHELEATVGTLPYPTGQDAGGFPETYQWPHVFFKQIY